jgi:hypothetical protein
VDDSFTAPAGAPVVGLNVLRNDVGLNPDTDSAQLTGVVAQENPSNDDVSLSVLRDGSVQFTAGPAGSIVSFSYNIMRAPTTSTGSPTVIATGKATITVVPPPTRTPTGGRQAAHACMLG